MNSPSGGFYTANLVINASTIADNKANGILMDAYEKTSEPGAGAGENNLTISDSIIANNDTNGIKIDLTNSATVSSSDIYGNFTRGIDASDSAHVIATGNWWGDASGPYDVDDNDPNGDGDRVTNNVRVDPWETTPLHSLLSASAIPETEVASGKQLYLPLVVR